MRNALLWIVAILLVAAAALFLPLPWTDTTRIHTEATIARPPQAVFDYVTTPGYWPAWHPSSLGVSGTTDHSLKVGERVTEHFRVAGRTGVVVWTVTNRQPPVAWVIDGNIDGRKAGVVAYTLAPQGAGTRFQRDFTYQSPNLLFAVLNRVMLRGRIEAESAEAVRRLKEALEKGPAGQ